MARTLLALLLVAAAFPALPADGAGIYAKACASCHGADGKGKSGPAVTGKQASFVTEVIGMHAPTMNLPKLSPADISAVSKYVSDMK